MKGLGGDNRRADLRVRLESSFHLGRGQLIEAMDRVVFDHGEDVCQVNPWIEFHALAALRQGKECHQPLGAFV